MEPIKESERTRTMKGSLALMVLAVERRQWEKDAHTLSPGESSVYNFSIVLDDPPAPAARDELGLETCDCDVPARRLQNFDMLEERNPTTWVLWGSSSFGHVPYLGTGRLGDGTCCGARRGGAGGCVRVRL